MINLKINFKKFKSKKFKTNSDMKVKEVTLIRGAFESKGSILKQLKH
jgi:hypothetical protein